MDYRADDFSIMDLSTDGTVCAKSIINQISPLLAAVMHDDYDYFIFYIKPTIEYMLQVIIDQNFAIFSQNYYNTIDYIQNMLYQINYERKQIPNPLDFGISLLFNHSEKITVCKCFQQHCPRLHIHFITYEVSVIYVTA